LFGTPTYNKDIARACALLVERDASGTFHLTGKEFVSRKDFALRVSEHYNLEHAVSFVETCRLEQSATRPLRSGLVNTRLEGFEPLAMQQALEDFC
jgi:dTDP-4-dehydrorhamnose reductase